MYMQGEGVASDLYTSFRYMSDAADMGCVEAMLYLGMSYTVGYLLYPEIIGISMIPFHRAEFVADGAMMLTGESDFDITEDEEQRSTVIRADARRAFEYFSAAAHADPTYCEDLVAKGKFLYAKCFLDGFGTEFNRTAGLNLMLSAGKYGSPEAVAYLAENGITERLLEEKNNGDNGNG
jgi:TPR repeat protein